MRRTSRPVWIATQGYRTFTLLPVVTWYAKGREFRGRTDNYTLALYRGKGFVLDKKFLDAKLWHELEYGVTCPVVTVELSQTSRNTPKA